MKAASVFLFLFVILASRGQTISCSPDDGAAFAKKMEDLETLASQPSETMIAEIGKTFLGTPYVAKTLEVGETESLVVNFQGLDCTTYVENVLALSHMVHSKKSDFDSFVSLLERIRYRGGKLEGYPSRLHYFSEWISDNEKKGLVKNITAQLGGHDTQKVLNFMSAHRDLYPFLGDDKNYEKIQATEEMLKDQSLFVLARERIPESEAKIQTGDIIALATSIPGLDVTHTGIALRKEDGRLHLLHASSSGQVEITELPLVDYLKRIKGNTGILVARPIF